MRIKKCFLCIRKIEKQSNEERNKENQEKGKEKGKQTKKTDAKPLLNASLTERAH